MTLLLTLFLIESCGSSVTATTTIKDNNSTENINGHFTISKLDTIKNLSQRLTLKFDDTEKKISGFSGCNRFFGKYTSDEKSINIGNLASTKMMCQEDENIIESLVLDFLSKTNNFLIENNTLVLKKDDKILLEASRQTAIKSTTDNNYTFEYSAISRGFYKLITITKKEITVINKRNSKPIIKICSDSNWENLINSLKTVDIKNIPNLKAPTENRFFDGAAIANLKITYNGTTYETASFDHGHPPKEIESLVKEILSISENIE